MWGRLNFGQTGWKRSARYGSDTIFVAYNRRNIKTAVRMSTGL